MSTIYGALIDVPETVKDQIGFKVNVAKELGIHCIRENIILSAPKNLKVLSDTDLELVLNVKWASVASGAIPFMDKPDIYASTLDSLLSKLNRKPSIVVIENEADNRHYYTGAAEQYLAILKACVPVVHKHGILIADSGSTGGAINNRIGLKLTRDEKKAMKARGFGCTSTREGEFAEKVLKSIKKIGVDIANFHWYQRDGQTIDLCNAIKYVSKTSGLPVMTNEIGQANVDSPDLVTDTLKHIKLHRLKYCIWYSGESTIGIKARALHNIDGSARDSGKAHAAEVKR